MLATVLIIDKRKELSIKYKKSIAETDINAVIARTLKDALVFVQTLEPDMIIVSDSIEEDLAGFCQKIRALTYNTRPIIVALSKSADSSDRINALESGAQKPSEAAGTQNNAIITDRPREKYAMIAVSSGDGIDEMFNEVGINVIVKGGQTMNPSSEDFVNAIKEANADNVFIFPNNSNIVMAASQACDIPEGANAFVIPSKTILQGISSAIRFNPEIGPEENFKEMKSALKNIKSGEVTFSIRDTEINGVSMNKDDFIGIFEKENCSS